MECRYPTLSSGAGKSHEPPDPGGFFFFVSGLLGRHPGADALEQALQAGLILSAARTAPCHTCGGECPPERARLKQALARTPRWLQRGRAASPSPAAAICSMTEVLSTGLQRAGSTPAGCRETAEHIHAPAPLGRPSSTSGRRSSGATRRCWQRGDPAPSPG